MKPRRRCRRVGRVAVAGLLALLAVSARAHDKIIKGLKITSPAGGTVVRPGDVITVTVAPLPGVAPTFVGLLGQFPLQTSACASQPCFRFAVTVPTTINRAGLYSIGAFGGAGARGAGSVFASDSQALDVEPGAAITNLNVEFSSLVFHRAGESLSLTVRGGFANGTSMDITESTEITYTSSDTKVATVNRYGVVTAVGTGCGPGGACVGVGMVYVSFGWKTVPVQISTSALRVAHRH